MTWRFLNLPSLLRRYLVKLWSSPIIQKQATPLEFPLMNVIYTTIYIFKIFYTINFYGRDKFQLKSDYFVWTLFFSHTWDLNYKRCGNKKKNYRILASQSSILKNRFLARKKNVCLFIHKSIQKIFIMWFFLKKKKEKNYGFKWTRKNEDGLTSILIIF